MIGFTKETPPVDLATIRSIFGAVGVPAATKVLQDKGIAYIGINELRDEIIIFTKKKLALRDLKLLEGASYIENGTRYAVSFKSGNVAQAGPSAKAPLGIPPYTKFKDRYTCGSSVYIGSEKGAGTLGCLVRDRQGQIVWPFQQSCDGWLKLCRAGTSDCGAGSLDVAAGGMDPTTLGHHADAYPFINGACQILLMQTKI